MKWQEADKQFLRDHPHESLRWLAEKLGKNINQVNGMLRRLGLRGKPPKRDHNQRTPREEKPWQFSSLSAYSDEQRDWLAAVLRWREKHGRPPTMIEAFRIAMAMGYQKGSGA